MELPQYTLHHTIKRMVIPRVITLIVLAPLFYLGIFINAKLLNFNIPPVIAVFIVIFLLVMVVVQSILDYVKFQKFRYLFYTNRIDYEGKKPKTFLYANFTESKLKQNMFDKMFNTGSIQLSKGFVIGPISNVSQIKTYMEQLIQYYKFSQQRYRMQQQQQKMVQETSGTQGQTAQTSQAGNAQTAPIGQPGATQTGQQGAAQTDQGGGS